MTKSIFQEMGGWHKLLTGQPGPTDIVPGRWRVIRLTILEHRRRTGKSVRRLGDRVARFTEPGRYK
jgi:hypothetical protein